MSSQYVLTVVQKCRALLSWGRLLFLFAFKVVFFLLLFFFWCPVFLLFFSPPWVLAGTLFMAVSQKEGSGAAKKGGDLGWLIPR